MGFDDKVKNAATDLQGKVKEAVGKVTGDSKQEAAGRADQAEADLKKAGEHVKDAFKN
ncbi:CsbD family protein [Dermatophilus congolensis]|uniref:CsbD family protein n=1 Tax=Dermatophilus congolensis TaxID=1863 RepID=UPI001AAF0808|nr:CsbD family protein [Dermatophilus congolensis]MBO3129404.1 CsbD family protein [Dermatophilus congolensis]MBO3131963.1 CsbD family protein [Dermatophilus congolensis]MBO3133881.1 CsbD family protein [Dermatophilus congolensis]MBO3136111.1 CsbD family protein [Dermatophilus congolensis]MBO3138355.1 CsbD family protein [Dermatophilus congolensis]